MALQVRGFLPYIFQEDIGELANERIAIIGVTVDQAHQRSTLGL